MTLATFLIFLILLIPTLLTLRQKRSVTLDKQTSVDLRGFGRFGVIFSHLGYFLYADHTFLYPLSIFGGVSVDLFFFMSGYGLAASSKKWAGKTKQYLIHRFNHIVVPIWIILTAFFILDAVFLSRFYPPTYILRSFLMWFRTDSLHADIDSPLWYITPLLLYYIIFPFVYKQSKPILSFLAFLIFGFAVSKLSKVGLMPYVYTLHYIAFPLGILAYSYLPSVISYIASLKPLAKALGRNAFAILILILVFVLGIHHGVGTWYEQYSSNFTMLLFVLGIVLIDLRSAFLSLIGAYAFEIYLIHWPLFSRYDVFQSLYNASAVGRVLWFFLWLAVIFFLAFVLRTLTEWYNKKYDVAHAA